MKPRDNIWYDVLAHFFHRGAIDYKREMVKIIDADQVTLAPAVAARSLDNIKSSHEICKQPPFFSCVYTELVRSRLVPISWWILNTGRYM